MALQLLSEFVILVLVVPPPPEVLVVIEDGGADGLLGPLLADDVLVDPPLEIAWVELRDAEGGLGEHGPAAFLVGIVGAGVAGVPVGRSSAGPEYRG